MPSASSLLISCVNDRQAARLVTSSRVHLSEAVRRSSPNSRTASVTSRSIGSSSSKTWRASLMEATPYSWDNYPCTST